MWRTISVHEKKETEFLDSAIERLEQDADLREKADAELRAVASQEPLFAEALQTPQSPHYHAEGPFLEDHLRLMLVALYAVLDERLHLIDIEEFRRMKGYEGEIDEMEEMIKENVAFMETFILCHDVGKWATVSFDAKEGSRGRAIGFTMGADDFWQPMNVSERAKMRERYLDLYQRFAEQHPHESDRNVQAQFFLAYGIELHYPGHARMIHAPVYMRLLERVSMAHNLHPMETAMLEDIIAHHLEPLHDFQEPRPAAIKKYVGMAEGKGYDADDFIDLFQACVFLDAVCGSKRRSAHGLWHNPLPIIHFLKSEHDAFPSRRKEKQLKQEQEEQKRRNQIFRQVGLDGLALMELLGMEPGPQFGRALRRIQSAVIGKGRMPHFSEEIDKEIENRVASFYAKWFVKDESYDD